MSSIYLWSLSGGEKVDGQKRLLCEFFAYLILNAVQMLQRVKSWVEEPHLIERWTFMI